MADTRKNQRRRCMFHAKTIYSDSTIDPVAREIIVWRCLLEWAALGGKPEDAIHA
jgi:hypothetical protein